MHYVVLSRHCSVCLSITPEPAWASNNGSINGVSLGHDYPFAWPMADGGEVCYFWGHSNRRANSKWCFCALEGHFGKGKPFVGQQKNPLLSSPSLFQIAIMWTAYALLLPKSLLQEPCPSEWVGHWYVYFQLEFTPLVKLMLLCPRWFWYQSI